MHTRALIARACRFTIPFLAIASGSPALRAADVIPPESLKLDGVPRISQDIADAARRYSEFRSAAFATWHPQRREMLVTTRFAETVQVHRVAFPRAARTQLTFFSEPIAGAAFPPHASRGDHYVFLKDVGGGEFYQLFRHDLADGKVTLLTDGKSRNMLGPFSRDGRVLAYTSTRRNGADTDIYLIDPRDPRTDRRVAEVKGGGWMPVDVSPDGKFLLVREYVSINQSHLWIFDVEGGGRRQLTERSTEPVSYRGGRFSADAKTIYTATDKGDEFARLVALDVATLKQRPLSAHIAWDVDELALSPDGRTIAIVTNEDGRAVLHLIDTRSGREMPQPKLPPGSVSGIDWHPSGRELGFTLGNARTPGDAFSLDVRSGKVERWTESETGGLDTSSLAEPELVKWPSFDQRSISGYLYRPPARFSGKRPVIISIHGGPESQFRPGYRGRSLYYLQELGVALLYPNVRGSSGYGKTFLKIDNGKLREDSVKDIGALLDWVKTRPELDAGRVMVTGGSYGGYMTFASSVRFADKIRCSVAIVGITNFVTFLERTESYRRDLRRVEYGDERDPDMRAFLTKISPLAHVQDIKKPILIVHGKNDPRVPVGESEQVVSALKKQKTPAWYLVAADEGHGFRRKRNVDFGFYAEVAFVKAFLFAAP